MPRRAALALILLSGVLSAHDIITTKITWDREISRIVYARCASCHRPDGAGVFTDEKTYVAKAGPGPRHMQEEVLERRMPSWGAVRGFRRLPRRSRTDAPRTAPELIAQWVDGGAPEGDDKGFATSAENRSARYSRETGPRNRRERRFRAQRQPVTRRGSTWRKCLKKRPFR